MECLNNHYVQCSTGISILKKHAMYFYPAPPPPPLALCHWKIVQINTVILAAIFTELTYYTVQCTVVHEKYLDSDWLRGVNFIEIQCKKYLSLILAPVTSLTLLTILPKSYNHEIFSYRSLNIVKELHQYSKT